ncbi:LysR family transcriptional regulator [bacterium]|nr:LysR family transcriptional regulator [bacterium]
MKPNPYNLNRLVYLKVLLAEKNVSRAAEKAGLSQPGMSHVLRELRTLFKDPLLVKGKNGWIPTEKAIEILHHLESGFAHLEAVLTNNTPFMPNIEKRHFRIICTDYIGVVLIPDLIRILQTQFPNISVELLPWTSFTDPAYIDQSDLVIGFFPKPTPKPYHEQLLYEEYYKCMIRTDHPRIKNTLTLNQFLKEKHAIVREQDGAIGVVNESLEKHNISRDVVLMVPSFLIFPFIIAQTDIIITTTSRNIRAFESILPIRSIENPLDLPKIPVKQIWHPRTHNSPAHQWLRQLIREIASKI